MSINDHTMRGIRRIDADFAEAAARPEVSGGGDKAGKGMGIRTDEARFHSLKEEKLSGVREWVMVAPSDDGYGMGSANLCGAPVIIRRP